MAYEIHISLDRYNIPTFRLLELAAARLVYVHWEQRTGSVCSACILLRYASRSLLQPSGTIQLGNPFTSTLLSLCSLVFASFFQIGIQLIATLGHAMGVHHEMAKLEFYSLHLRIGTYVSKHHSMLAP